MRLLVVSNLFPPDVLGGYELLCADVVAALRSSGHQVEVLTSGRVRPDDPPWVHRSLALVRPFGAPAGLERLRHAALAGQHRRAVAAQLARAPVDAALLFSQRRLGLHATRALAAHGVPRVAVMGDDWILAHAPAPGATWWRRATARLLERGPLAARTWRGASLDATIVVSQHLAATLAASAAPIGRVHVVAQGVDQATFAPRTFRPVGGAPRLLWVGRLHHTKACDVAIDAVARLRAGGVAATLTIAGDGAERDALVAQVARLGLADAVQFAGQRDRRDLPALYRDHDVFVFTGRVAEAAGLTHLEARACGVPVVAQANCGAGEYLRHDDDAMIAADAPAIASAIQELIADPARARRLVEGGLRTVSTQASLPAFVTAIERAVTAAVR